MKTIMIVRSVLMVLGLIFAPCVVYAKNKIIDGMYITVGKISDPLLHSLLDEGFSAYQALERKERKRVRAVLLDGKHLTSMGIKSNPSVQQAVIHSVPIVISEPTSEQVKAITGVGVCADAMVIVAKKMGTEFEMNVVEKDSRKKSGACWIGVGPGPGGYWGNDAIHKIIKIIDNKIIRNEDEIGEFINDAIGCHKRWTIQRAQPYVWGSQGQQVHIGFQYDMYYVTSPLPVRKYLTVKTVGKGASPGVLKADSRFHRGYYQNALTIRLEHEAEMWTGEELKLEDMAPRSDNHSGQIQVATGFQFSMGGQAGGSNTNAGLSLGFSLTMQETRSREFHDFTVSQDGNPDAEQWTYWLSAAGGAALRRKHQAADLVGFAGVREIPELARGSMLKPYIEAVYFADGNENGRQRMRATVEQRLQDVKGFAGLRKVRQITGVLSQDVVIDFSQVDAQCN